MEFERDFVTDLAKRIESGDLTGLQGWRQMHELIARFPGGRVPPDEGEKFLKKWGMPTPPN
ncbi:hypothetical protein [Nocardia arthritidis]|uniref:Uncharacterized protein n=1 Tax=Nocardia arthritidis TaxID=228602 RepID=A0A6G9Y841_9NOCA|nr:hypothetical protein [Nocardia arthritidis]QIS09371.1 hypothetical protein F5544_07320 [Nocardia arthritidis]